MNDKPSDLLYKLFLPVLGALLAALVGNIPTIPKIILACTVVVLVGAIIIGVPGRFVKYVAVPVVVLIGLAIAIWWWRTNSIPGDVVACRTRVLDIQAELELPDVCVEADQAGGGRWYRKLTGINRELIYEEMSNDKGQKERLYYASPTDVVARESNNLQQYFEDGFPFAYDILDKTRQKNSWVSSGSGSFPSE